MPKVLIVGENRTQLAFPAIFQLLQNLGIETAFAHGWTLTGTVSTPVGAFSPASNDLRNYFKQFDAIFVFDRQSWDSAFGVRVSIPWLGWTNADDPPVAYMNWHFGTAVTQYDGQFPADFPLIRINPSDLAGTAALVDGGAALLRDIWARHATAIFLHREDATVYVPTFTAWELTTNHRLAYWRYNPSQHSTLANQNYTHAVAANGKAGELLATPANVPPDSYPSNTVVGYRYYNRFILPGVRLGYFCFPRHANLIMVDIFWILYALKLCGVRPAWAIPLQIETDHPLELRPQSANLTDLQKVQLKRDCFDWWRGFCRETGLVVINGVQVGGRDRNPTNVDRHWYMINHADTNIRAVAQQVHQILVAGHGEGTLMCGVHDHSINDTRGYGSRREMTNFIRHSDTGSLYGAPSDVPIQHGQCCVARHVLPAGAAGADARETVIGSETITEWGFTGRTAGTGTTIATMPMQNVHAARVVLESDMLEMRAMGFPDGHCGEHRYTNTAANNAGGIAWWQAAREMGLRALRSGYCCNEHSSPSTQGANNQTVPPTRVWEGFHLLPLDSLDIASSAESSTWGLYDPSAGASGRHAVGWFALDSASSDIIGQWATSRQTASWRAHGRALSYLSGRWLAINALNLGAAYVHPAWVWYGCSVSQPVARFDGENLLNVNGQPHWNPVVELMENMRAIVRVLSDYLQFGSVSDLIAVREKVLG
jgi:hypothetical protein